MDARQVTRAFGVHVSTIYRLTDRFLQNNNVVDRPRSGCPRVTSQRQDRNIVRTHMRDRFLPATTTARQTVGTHNLPVSDTVRRRLIAVHLNCRRPYIGQRLTQRHRIARHNWAVLHRQWRNRQWQNIVFSDESRYCVDRADGRMRVWRRRGERFTDACVMERDSWGGPSIVLWGAISWTVGEGLPSCWGVPYPGQLGRAFRRAVGCHILGSWGGPSIMLWGAISWTVGEGLPSCCGVPYPGQLGRAFRHAVGCHILGSWGGPSVMLWGAISWTVGEGLPSCCGVPYPGQLGRAFRHAVRCHILGSWGGPSVML